MEDLYGLFKRSPELKVYYFIGRLNPPHPGHIETLIQMIQYANADNSVPLIILGSGPKRERTMDNPIPFETKEAFLHYILPRRLKYEIRQMTTGLADVELWYQSILSHINPPSCVEFIRFAGDKGDNATKLQYMDTHLGKLPQCKARTFPIPPVMADAATEMSATTVRKFAYKSHLDQLRKGTNGFASFDAKYGGFYKEFTRNIYSDILFPVIEASPEDIERYLSLSKMPSKSKTKKNGPKRSKSKGRKRTANGGNSSNSE
jgi:hypothetical protein